MMASTYAPIATYTTLNSSSTSYTFSSIPSGYTDLILIANVTETPSTGSFVFRINSDSGTNYSTTYFDGNGSSSISGRYTNQTSAYLTYEGVGTGFGTYILNFQNYSNNNSYKTIITRASNAGNSTEATVSLWRSTAAINSITLYAGQYFNTGVTFNLYGIKGA